MTTRNPYPWLAVSLIALVLGACANREPRDDTRSNAPQPATRTQSAPTQPRDPAAAPTPAAASAPTTPPMAEVPVTPADDAEPQFTGIEVCDEYLARYRACHSTIGVVAADQIDERLATLRATWQERARNVSEHEALRAQCQNLTDTMQEALNGRDCELPENDFYRPDAGTKNE